MKPKRLHKTSPSDASGPDARTRRVAETARTHRRWTSPAASSRGTESGWDLAKTPQNQREISQDPEIKRGWTGLENPSQLPIHPSIRWMNMCVSGVDSTSIGSRLAADLLQLGPQCFLPWKTQRDQRQKSRKQSGCYSLPQPRCIDMAAP